MKRIFFSLLVAVVMMSCGEKMSVKDVEELESKVLAKDAKPTKDNVIQLVDAYLLFAQQNPNDLQSPDFLFKALDVAVGVNAEGPQKAIDIANVLIEKYPDFEMTQMAMFVKGFVFCDFAHFVLHLCTIRFPAHRVCSARSHCLW